MANRFNLSDEIERAADNAALQGELESLQEPFGQQLAKVNKLTERVRVLEGALRDAGDAIEWMYQCTAPASDDVEAAIRAARAPLEQKRPEPDCRNCRHLRLLGGPWCDIRDRCANGSEYLQMPPVKLYRIQSKESP